MTAAKRQGFSLIESLLALTLFSMIVLSTLEFFGMTKKTFFKLRDTQLAQESAWAALDKIRTDLLQAGQGLIEPLRFGIVKGIEFTDGAMVLTSRAKSVALSSDALAGSSTIDIDDADDFLPGKTMCLFDKDKGEAQEVGSAGTHRLTLTAPLVHSYSKEESVVLLLHRTAYYLDAGRSTLRRKVNSGIPQPLLDGVLSYASGYDSVLNLVTVSLRLQSGSEKTYEIMAFPKNVALAKNP
jgi:prepilin-type N-terminal cleavage/methylation domain-containing protein